MYILIFKRSCQIVECFKQLTSGLNKPQRVHYMRRGFPSFLAIQSNFYNKFPTLHSPKMLNVIQFTTKNTNRTLLGHFIRFLIRFVRFGPKNRTAFAQFSAFNRY
jgi:hypothetical protein